MFQNHTTEEVTGKTRGTIRLSETNRTVAECIDAWMREADEYEQRGIASEGVNTLRRCAKELAAARQAEEEREVSLCEASRLCGYSPDHLGSLTRSGILANYGRIGAPRVRVSQLPRKAGALTQHVSKTNVRTQIARKIAHSLAERSDV